MWWAVVSVFLAVCTVGLVRFALISPIFRVGQQQQVPDGDAVVCSSNREDAPEHVVVFLGSGGHTGEMLRLLKAYQGVLVSGTCCLYVCYADGASSEKIRQLIAGGGLKLRKVVYIGMPKAREVGSSKVESVRSIVRSMYHTYRVVVGIRAKIGDAPHLVLFNGPGTCCVLTLWLRTLDIFMRRSTKIVYVESLARIKTLSMTGRLLYPFVDEFVVQWPELARRYRRARYFGILV
ncbi:N-acetylglucosaminyldiphosphodolichol N-acetylglucosaminyltransferase anchoring subunit ALG14 Ecym_2667 [Eremothecium cymbalariae DBVPG|uniref:UDP-N-acetylglucosamine transferase subunit ALG14 n=1 Tax=Eremothecium cymbalariae (strain CBS 270.75 / DBVPG 7215 / KCTC 17166 / NRRL Y-17582) TaxID=931890 RepID=G8JNV2_ERECY|nr:Hypothetical protein Ecym_2667 [Eremothecium cymbalariae DBVPG\